MRAYLGLGSNLGDRRANIDEAIRMFAFARELIDEHGEPIEG